MRREDDLAADFHRRRSRRPSACPDERRILDDPDDQAGRRRRHSRRPRADGGARHAAPARTSCSTSRAATCSTSSPTCARSRPRPAASSRSSIPSTTQTRDRRGRRPRQGGRHRPGHPAPSASGRTASATSPPGLVLRPRALRRHPLPTSARISSSSSCSSPARPTPRSCRPVANLAHPDTPELRGLRPDGRRLAPGATGYIRVDWFTPDGLPTWGDGRLFLVGTEGTIELRKYIDVAGRPGSDHLFLVDRKGTPHIDCSRRRAHLRPRSLRDDVRNRTETAMPQTHCFLAMELALDAAGEATRIGGEPAEGTQMSRRMKVGVVGGGVGRRTSTATRRCPTVTRSRRSATSTRKRAAKVAAEYGIAGGADAASRTCSRATSTSSTSARRRACTSPRRSQALEAGKHVVGEKPLVGSLAEADALTAAERQRQARRRRSSSTASATASRSPSTSATTASPASPMSPPSRPTGGGAGLLRRPLARKLGDRSSAAR